MTRTAFLVLAALALPVAAVAQQPPTMGQIFSSQLRGPEKEMVSLLEAMPEDKFDFAPKEGEFKGVRTFAQQATHAATVLYMVSASVLEEKCPVEAGEHENGPASLKTKAEIVKYVKDAFAYGQKAMGKLTTENFTALVPSAFGSGKSPRGGMADIAIWHTFDHYGQMVVYARMCGIVPPASKS